MTPREIRLARMAKGWSRKQLARHLGYSWHTIHAWEFNRAKPSAEAKRRLRRVFSTKQGTPEIECIIALVAEDTGVSAHDILGPWQNHQVSTARQLCAWLARHSTHLSFPQIGRALNRDHSTVMRAVAVIDGDPEKRTAASRLLELLSPQSTQHVNSLLLDARRNAHIREAVLNQETA